MIKPTSGTVTAKRRRTEDPTLGLSPNALTVLENRYLDRDENGNVKETPAQLFRRVSHHVAKAEEQWGASATEMRRVEDAFYGLMVDRVFMPNSPTLMNAGRPLGMLSACFVLPLEDSIPDIMETARQIALVQRAGGGTGVDLSQLRPAGSIVRSSGGRTEGPLSFLKMLSGVTDAIQQGAFRRGANMGMLRVDHPDILSFIDVKSDLNQVTNYNLSVSMTDTFMKQLEENPRQPHEVRDPDTGRTGALRRSDSAVDFESDLQSNPQDYWSTRDLWERIISRAWESGEPGLIFIDEINRMNQTPNVFEMRATNPCGEQPLGPYEACTLGSINVATFFRPNQRGAAADRIDWKGMAKAVRMSVRFLDDVVEANHYPTPEIHKACHGNRKIGLGVMGWADLLFRLGVRYDSQEALELAKKLGTAIRDSAWDASTELAEKRGCFPNWKDSVWDVKHGRKMRNAHCVTIAPTGTISIISGCSGGIEPIFSLAFTRQVLNGKTLHEVNPIFQEALEDAYGELENGKVRIEEVTRHVSETGSVQDVGDLPEHAKEVYRTSRDIGSTWHVRMQAAWQESTDAAVSKTINLPADADTKDVEDAYLLAHRLKCKGITVYRDGSRQMQPMALKAKKKESAPAEPKAKVAAPDSAPSTTPVAPKGLNGKTVHTDFTAATPISLPELMPCVRVRQLTPFGNMHVKISVEPKTGIEREVFAQLGKGGDLATSDLEAICRILSLFLRCNGALGRAVGQLQGIGSSLSVPSRDGRIMSLADGLAHALRKYMEAKEQFGLRSLLLGEVDPEALSSRQEGPPAESVSESVGTMFKVKCPDCSGNLSFSEGCVKCLSCGFSQC